MCTNTDAHTHNEFTLYTTCNIYSLTHTTHSTMTKNREQYEDTKSQKTNMHTYSDNKHMLALPLSTLTHLHTRVTMWPYITHVDRIVQQLQPHAYIYTYI